jgi:hypothetical protein
MNIPFFSKKQKIKEFEKLVEEKLSGLETRLKNNIFDEGKVFADDDANSLSKKLKEINSYSRTHWEGAGALAVLYTKTKTKRQEIIRAIDQIRDNYLVMAMTEQLMEDALRPDHVTKDMLELHSTNKEIQKELQYLEEELDIEELILTILPDVILYGDYIVKVEFGGKNRKGGIVNIRDTVDQIRLIPVQDGFSLLGYIELSEDGKYLQMIEPYDYIRFSLSGKKYKLDLYQEFTQIKQEVLEELGLPKYMRIGKSMFYPVLDKVKELELLEKLVPATKLAQLSNGTIVGVQVPQNYDPKKAMEAAQHIENLINKKVGVDKYKEELTLENIMSSSGKIKVVPVFGQTGQLQKFDYKMTEESSDLLQSIREVRQMITESMGIPYEILFGSDNPQPKGEFLKRYARYLQRLSHVQASVSNALKQIIYIHLLSRGISFTSKDIEIKFKQNLISIDNLDNLEFADAATTMLSNTLRFVQDVEQSDLATVNREVFLEYLNSQFKLFGLNDLFLPKIG